MRKSIFLLLVLSILLIPPISPSHTWVSRAPTPSTGGYGQAVVGTGNCIYVVRCYNVNSSVQFWRYNPSTDSWITLSTDLEIGTFRNGTCLAWDNGDYIYALAGARYEDSDRRLFLRYRISANTWTVLPETPAPQGAGDAMAWCGRDGKLYALLGSSQHGTSFARYDPSAQTWTMLSSPPGGTDDGASLAWAGGRYLFALRGEYYESSPLREFWRYDIETDTWASVSPIPDQGGVGDGGSLLWVPDQPDYLYALGGGSYDENGGYGFFRYRISTDSWETLEDLPYPVGYCNGNRLAFALSKIYYWQGTPSTWPGGGNSFCAWGLQNLAPAPSFTYSPQNPTAGILIQFADNSVDPDGTIVSWYWEFGDGGTSTDRNSTHTYQQAGSYAVRLTVTDDGGLSSSTSKTITVLARNQPPVASFIYFPENPVAGDPVQFTDNSQDPDGSIVSLWWEFGDGTTASISNPIHTYLSPGTYTVSLTVADDGGQLAMCVRIITVSSANMFPKADFQYFPKSPHAGDPVRFTDLSEDPDGKIVSWTWDFGDGTTSTLQNPTHAYAEAGTYTVTLVVADNGGMRDNCWRTITVSEPPLVLIFRKSDGSPLSHTGIYLKSEKGEERLLGATDNEGRITLNAGELAGTFSFRSGDGRYVASATLPSSGEVEIEVREREGASFASVVAGLVFLLLVGLAIWRFVFH